MKNLVITLLLLFGVMLVQAQTDTTDYENDALDIPFPPMDPDPEYLAALADTCRTPYLTSNSVVTYATGSALAYIRVSGLRPGQMVAYMNTNNPSATVVPITFYQGTATLNNLQHNQRYALRTVNNCGQPVIVGYIDTRTGPVAQIEVSEPLFNAIQSFQKMGTGIALSTYLTGLNSIPFYEKVAFLQKYWYDGAPLTTNSGSQLPPMPPPREGEECRCSFVFNMARIVTPGTMNADGTISPDIFKEEKVYASYGKHWRIRQSRGPAKYHQIWNEASKAGGADRLNNMTMTDSLNIIAPTKARLRYNLFCTNYAQVPSNCGCRKPITIYWQYDTDVTAHAERHQEGVGTKKAVAGAEDAAIIISHVDESGVYDLLQAKRARAQAECNLTVNPAFWDSVVDIAANIAKFFLPNGTTGQPDYDALVNNLKASLQGIIGTPYYSQQDCNLDANVEATLLFGDKQFMLEPNKTLNIIMSSFTNIMAGGRRSFHSWARINSDFYLAGYVPGGLFANESENHCCTRKIGDWILASDGPLSVQNLKEEVGLIFAAFNPWPYPSDPLSGIVQLPTEYGWMTAFSHEDCEMPINPNGAGLKNGNTTDRDNSLNTEMLALKVFDLSGKLLYEGKEAEVSGDLRPLLTRLGVSNAGIYIVQLSGQNRREVHKVIMK